MASTGADFLRVLYFPDMVATDRRGAPTMDKNIDAPTMSDGAICIGEASRQVLMPAQRVEGNVRVEGALGS